MSVGPMGGIVGSAAGAPLSQTAGSESERAKRESSATERQIANDTKAEKAAGIGQTEGDEGPSERDADGRRLWEGDAPAKKTTEPSSAEGEPPRKSKDPTGQSGSSLDLTG
ncbi:MAG: hypothetical protein AAGD11_08300 [Planctomycetota bacterium]